MQLFEKLAGTFERLALVAHPQELLVLGVAQIVAVATLGFVPGHGRDELITAHPDVPVDAPDRHDEPAAAQRAEPGEGVLVVRVDECAVQVEENGDFRGQLRNSSAIARLNPAAIRAPEPMKSATSGTRTEIPRTACGETCVRSGRRSPATSSSHTRLVTNSARSGTTQIATR